MGETKNIYKISVRKPEGKRPLRRTRRRWENNTRMVLREIRWEGVDWMHRDQDKDQWWTAANTVINFRVV
jgi:hypothetical protein